MVHKTIVGLVALTVLLAGLGIALIASSKSHNKPSGNLIGPRQVAVPPPEQILEPDAPQLRSEPLSAVRTQPAQHNPPLLGELSQFSLTDQSGQPFTSLDLLGKAWIASFASARDADDQQRIAALGELQARLSKTAKWDQTRLVTFTTDPEHDTAEVLQSLAEQVGADGEHWKFLTGSEGALDEIRDHGFQPLHSDADGVGRFVSLVDPQGQVRGFYDLESKQQLTELRGHLKIVLQESMLLKDTPWLESRRQAQLAAAQDLEVVHDFSFIDRVQESGIDFQHRVVDDAGRSFVTAHYDHGNGIAIADVDGDRRPDIYFVNQVGSNQLWRNLGHGKFENITERAGVAVPEPIGVAASFADIDNDGDPDLYVTTVRGGNFLFENDGAGNFTDISADAGVDYNGHSSGAVFFDYNRDGLLDLFLVNVGAYTNDELVTMVQDPFAEPDPAAYSYYRSTPDAFASHLKPWCSEASILYQNQGGNRFQDVTDETQLRDVGWTGDASPLDANNDGWPDLYLVNMQGHDEYYENVEGKHFVKKSREVFPATPWGTMGIKVFDFDNDGRLDIYLTDMHTDMFKHLEPWEEKQKMPKEMYLPDLHATDGNHVWGNAFFHKQEDGTYQEKSDQLNAENYWPWGLSVGDLNADGFEDVFITSSMNFLYRYGINSLLLNDRGQGFVDAEFILGVEPRRGGRTMIPWFELDAASTEKNHDLVQRAQSRGVGLTRVVAWGALGSRSSVIFDLDDDGDLDIVTNDFNSEPLVLVSDLSDRQPVKFLKVRLTGTASNRDALGARVTVRAGDNRYTRVNDGQSGYLSQSQSLLYYGLGAAATVDQVEVVWPSGKIQTVAGPIEVNTTLDVTEE